MRDSYISQITMRGGSFLQVLEIKGKTAKTETGSGWIKLEDLLQTRNRSTTKDFTKSVFSICGSVLNPFCAGLTWGILDIGTASKKWPLNNLDLVPLAGFYANFGLESGPKLPKLVTDLLYVIFHGQRPYCAATFKIPQQRPMQQNILDMVICIRFCKDYASTLEVPKQVGIKLLTGDRLVQEGAKQAEVDLST
ncbi:hypothetical protein VNO77_19895 [Canavalia gladiata]|uniref:Uncharacterized protein n=1 Tax=Canavalia gladiata TaxID=3824 RepID=A0AAN9LNJ6_CANGL